VDGVSFEVLPGETLGIVGRVGLRQDRHVALLFSVSSPSPGHIRPGSFIEFEGRNLLT